MATSIRAMPSAQFPWAMLILPLVELISFVAAVFMLNHSVWLACALLLLAGLSLSFGIHIFFHECVHRRYRYPAWFKWFATIWMGLPFDGYRVHHYNHHHFENGLQDFSSTWIYSNNSKRPRRLLPYVLGWPRQVLLGMRCKTPFGGQSRSANRIKANIPSQKKALLLAIVLMGLVSWKLLLMYVALVYLGWAFTSLHNYGQHPPTETEQTSTYTGAVYNRLFFNNGLHWEHHNKPALPTNTLTLDDRALRIDYPHVLIPIIQLLDKFLQSKSYHLTKAEK
jgi:fatty acid desaturase